MLITRTPDLPGIKRGLRRYLVKVTNYSTNEAVNNFFFDPIETLNTFTCFGTLLNFSLISKLKPIINQQSFWICT